MSKNRLIITSAIYGRRGSANPNETNDVTAEINRRIKDNKFHFAQSYNDIFGDPYEGHRKELRIRGKFVKWFRKFEFNITYRERNENKLPDEIKLPEDILHHSNTNKTIRWRFITTFSPVLLLLILAFLIFKGWRLAEIDIWGAKFKPPTKEVMTTSTEESENLPPKQESLHEYFTTDFSQYLSMDQNIGITVLASSSATNKKEDYELEFRLHCDFDSLTKFISVYLPSSTYQNVKTISKEIAVKASDVADGISSSRGIIVNGSRYGDRGSEIKDLKFSGRIYIYHQAYLSGDDIDELRRFYEEKGFDPIFRDSNYLTTRWLWDKDKFD